MNKTTRMEWKVGLFVLIGLVLVAALMLNFSKGITLFQSTYKLHLIMTTVSGLKPHADVMMSGVQVGNVSIPSVAPDGTQSTITVQIFSKYQIPHEREFPHRCTRVSRRPIYRDCPSTNDLGTVSEQTATCDWRGAVQFAGSGPFTSGLLEMDQDNVKRLDQAITDVQPHDFE